MDSLGLGGIPSPTPQQQSSEFSKWRLSIDQTIDEIKRMLRGESLVMVTDESGDTYQEWRILPGSKPVCNERGIAAIMSNVTSVLNRNTFLSNLDEDRIMDIAKDFHGNLKNEVFLNHSTWEFDKYRLYMLRNISQTVMIGMMRAKAAGERDSMSKTHLVTESIDRGQKQKGFSWGNLNPLSKGSEGGGSQYGP